MATPFEQLLDELEQADTRRRMTKALRHNSDGFNRKRQHETKRQMAKALSDLQGLQRQVTKETTLAKAQRLQRLYAAARAEMANAIGRRPSHEIAAMESRLARAGEQLHAAGII